MDPSSARGSRAPYWPALLLPAALASLRWPLIALPVAFGCFVALLTSAGAFGRTSAARWALLVATSISGFALVRFVAQEAVPGIVGGGQRAVEQRAISRLRDLLFAQDAMRRAAWIDPDGDGVGSAAFLEELCGEPPLRGQPERATSVLECGPLVETPLGPAARDGAYLYTLCLPTRDGGWSARPDAAVDEERAERAFVAYAWPAPGTPFRQVFFIDQHESILMFDPLREDEPGRASSPAVSAQSGPACDAALGNGRERWSAWRGKRPRSELPGDGKAELSR